MKKFGMMLMVIAGLSLGACQSNGWGQKQTVGTGLGAVGGGLLGAQIGDGSGQIIATAAGTLLGAYLGNEVGASLDRADMMMVSKAETRAHTAAIGETVNWNNPDSGNYGTVTPVRDGTSTAGRYCREYQQTVTIDGQQQSAYGTACQQPDGSWEIIG